ncbi:FecR family protein [Herbaspirillum sp. WKF16]|uniref:FecR family protein n=1 Tax=Herbaspirillum sp. WKF16 TaxID=3028312 RepID=UPI0023A9236D|nr:FecR family protein [Herbaspirillum sp. WKF16]WDZ96249.1 FecR family protein [Herbaspirillum sp. WKF16]
MNTACPPERQPTMEPDQHTVEQAIDWLTRLGAGELGLEGRSAYRRWREQDPRHALAAQRLEQMFARFDGLVSGPAASALEAVAPARKRGHAAARRAVAAGIVLALGAGLWAMMPQARYWSADYRTAAGERRTVELPDHSTLTLNSRSAVNVRYEAGRRSIELLRGEILVDVAHIERPQERPFAVRTEDGEARALGTRYLVRDDGRGTVVTVLESKVRAASADGASARMLAPGERATITPAAIGPTEKLDAELAASWTSGRLVADNMPLVEVLDALARYRGGMLRYDRAQLARLRVSGVFALDDPDRVLQTLQSVLPIRVARYSPLLSVVSAAAGN